MSRTSGNNLSQAKSKKMFGNLPLKQRLYLEYKEKLESLYLEYPHIAYSFSESELSTNFGDVIEKAGFSSHSGPNQEIKVLIKNITTWVKRGRLVLVHYRPKSKEYSLIDILREVKKITQQSQLINLIPIFMGAVSSKQQLDVFRLLGSFGIKYAIFATPNVAVEKNVQELLKGLHEFSTLIKGDSSLEQQADDIMSGFRTITIARYKEHVSRGDELMKSGDLEGAIKEFSAAIESNPDFDILMKRGDAYYRQEEYIPALKDYREANKLKQDRADPFAKISTCCFTLVKESVKKGAKEKAKKWLGMGMKNIDSANRIIDKMQKENAASPEKLVKNPYASIVAALSVADLRGLGFEEEEKKISSLTAEILEKTENTDYMDSDIDVEDRINEAMLLARNMHYQKAEEIFRFIINENPQNVGPAFNNFAIELRKNGQYGKSFEIYVELLNYDIPDRDIVVQNLKTAGMKYRAYLESKNKKEEAANVLKKLQSYG